MRSPVSLLQKHSALAPLLANAFEELRVSAALWVDGAWYPIHVVPTVVTFEIEKEVASQRWAYNTACLERVMNERKVVHGEHAGFRDLFVPVARGKNVEGILVAGPLATARPERAEVMERWNWLTAGQGRATDPRLSQYLAATLSTLTLTGRLLDDFQRFMECLSAVIAGHGPAEALAKEATALRAKLIVARMTDRMWEAARSMVDERSARVWAAPANAGELGHLGLKRLPGHVVVGLLLGRQDDADWVEDHLRRDAFQRECAELARKVGRAISGRVGDHGVVFLVDAAASGRERARLGDFGERAAAIARAHGLKLHLGVSESKSQLSLPIRYQAALAAAAKTLSSESLPDAAGTALQRPERRLYELRRRLGQVGGESASLLLPRFEQYLEAAAAHSGYRLEPTRAHLEAGFERIVESLSATGALGERSLKDVWRALDRSAGAVSNVRALMAAYRRAVMDIERVMSESTGARQIRGTRRAMTYIREHLGEPLSLDKVSRMAGFAPSYFSKLVKREEGVPFEQYARQLRLERAKQMLSGTSFGVAQVAQQCGFGTRNYFHEAFKRAEGMGPSQYRNKVRLERAQELLGVTTETIERVAEISGLGGVEQLERVFKRSLGMTPLEYRQRWRKSRPRRKSV